MESLAILIIIVVFGLVCLLSGYTMLPFLYGTAGFAVGFAIWHILHPSDPWFTEPALVIALACMFLCVILHEFMMMALVFFLILSSVAGIRNLPIRDLPMVMYSAGVVFGICGAMLLHKLFRPCMMIMTAGVGAALLSKVLGCVYWYFQQPSAGFAGLSEQLSVSLTAVPEGWNATRGLYSILFFALAIWGVWTQQRKTRRG